MRFPLRFRATFVAALLPVAALWPRAAHAQSVTLNATTVQRSLPIPGHNQYNWVNFNDCEQDLVLTFPLLLDGPAITGPYTLQAWAGDSSADCSQVTSRNAPGTSTQVCWPVLNTGITRNQTVNPAISIRDILSQYGSGAKGPYQGPYGEQACHNPALPTGQTQINVWFLLLDGSGNSVGTPAQFNLSVALIGPAAPSAVNAGIADTALVVSWTPSGDPATQGYTIYCDPPPNGHVPSSTDAGASTTSDAGTYYDCQDAGFTDGGFDDAGDAMPGTWIDGGCQLVANPSPSSTSSSSGGGGSTCPSTVLVGGGGTTTTNEAGQPMTVGGTQKFVDPAYICGSIGSATSTSVNATGLTDGVYYTVAVAAVDNYGNTGPLSNPACNTPQQVIDFWQTYRDDGGQAGGGFCSVKDLGSPATAAPLIVFGVWAVLAIARRRREKK